MLPEEVLARWGIEKAELKDSSAIQGSPRRVKERYLLEYRGDSFVLERISPHKRERKEALAETLDILGRKGLPVERYLRAGGMYVVEHRGAFWMMKEYMEGDPPKRPDFLKQGWMGKEAALFIRNLNRASKEESVQLIAPHMPSFISRMMRSLERRSPETYRVLKPMYSSISGLMKEWDSLPSSFTHGDFHPMNIIWGKDGINAVIDWEFAGMRPEMYDVAMMLGCLGAEDSEGLFSGFAEEFLNTMKGNFEERSWKSLPEMMLATRFAWMDEWMKNRDERMIDAELVYMQALQENMKELRDFLE